MVEFRSVGLCVKPSRIRGHILGGNESLLGSKKLSLMFQEVQDR